LCYVSVAVGAVYGGDNGTIGGKNYPMAKKGHSLEFLREKAHLRARSKLFSSAMRMRHAMAFATHKFFNERGFVYTHTPLITAADCEGTVRLLHTYLHIRCNVCVTVFCRSG
jgi:aspartyl/asparaginyl-tRNA synthetase